MGNGGTGGMATAGAGGGGSGMASCSSGGVMHSDSKLLISLRGLVAVHLPRSGRQLFKQ